MKFNSLNQKSLYAKGFFLLALGLVGAGCGESFQGTFAGDKISVFNPTGNTELTCSGVVGQDFEIRLSVQVSGDSVETTITKLAQPGQSDSPAARVVTGYAVGATLQNDTTFHANNAKFKDGRTVGDRTENVSVSGRISAGRDQIDNFEWIYEGFIKDSDTPCSLGVRGTGLRIVP